MKKFTSTLLAVTAMTVSAFAGSAVESKTGFYLGGNVGLANTNAKYNFVTSGTGTGEVAGAQNTNIQAGSMNALFGLFAGYGMQVGSMYFGGEAYAGLDSTKVTAYDDSNTASVSSFWKTTVKRTNFYGLAPRLGFVAGNALVYVRLGVEAGKWTTNTTLTGTASSGHTLAAPVNTSKNSISFAPGVGIEASLSKNLFLRAEYSYLFGPSVKYSQDVTNDSAVAAATATHTVKITQQSFKVGVGYKF